MKKILLVTILTFTHLVYAADSEDKSLLQSNTQTLADVRAWLSSIPQSKTKQMQTVTSPVLPEKQIDEAATNDTYPKGSTQNQAEIPQENQYQYIQPIAIEQGIVEKPLDSDKDGVYDEFDECPQTPLGIIVNEKGCELDSDGDGVVDSLDNCPDTPEGTEVDESGCELDSDGDGVLDSLDACPDTSEYFKVDEVGCPKTAKLELHFAPNKYDITDRLMVELEEFAQFLEENSGYQVIIYGYTDSVGTFKANKILSQNRANSVKEALIRAGIDKDRLTAVGKGEENPEFDNMTKEGRAKNRRIEAELL